MDEQTLCDKLGYAFKDASLLRRALTHPSASGDDNQRLEFLGDAVLQLCMSDIIYTAHSRMREGQMTHLRALLVCQDALCNVARALGLGQHIAMDKSCAASGGRDKPSILSDAMEAVLAAVYLDGGFAAARAVIARLWKDDDSRDIRDIDSKSLLQQRLQADQLGTPTYDTVLEQGPPHLRTFTVAVYLAGRELARGTGASKKRAEQEAAKNALAAFAKEP